MRRAPSCWWCSPRSVSADRGGSACRGARTVATVVRIGGGTAMPKVPTTAGEIDVDDLGPVLMHEHVFIRTEALQLGWPGFGGWDAEAEVAAACERLRGLSRAGVGAILDMSVPGLYRDPALVARAAEGTGLKVMFATGYYTYDDLPFPFQYRGRGKILDDDHRDRRHRVPRGRAQDRDRRTGHDA